MPMVMYGRLGDDPCAITVLPGVQVDGDGGDVPHVLREGDQTEPSQGGRPTPLPQPRRGHRGVGPLAGGAR